MDSWISRRFPYLRVRVKIHITKLAPKSHGFYLFLVCAAGDFVGLPWRNENSLDVQELAVKSEHAAFRS